jgi:hypothetical protein
VTLSDERAARNEALFREVNEEVARLEFRLEGDDEPQFVCECADETCVERVSVPLAAYEELRSHPRRFVLKPGHQHEDIERVVESTHGYVVVEKTAAAGVVAERTDPRS